MVKLAVNLLQQKTVKLAVNLLQRKTVKLAVNLLQQKMVKLAVNLLQQKKNGHVSSKFATVKMINFLLQIFQVSSKNGKLFVADFSDFYLAVSASVNDANYRKPNSFITPMTRDMDRNILPAVKTENFFSPIFLIFIWL